ncbi:MAG: TIGR01212 family radical SAM protein [Bacillota bacterium]
MVKREHQVNKQEDTKQPGWYYRLSNFFRSKFGEPIYKIPLDAGFSCPNRDGTIGNTGCSYCYNPSFSPFSGDAKASINEQLQRGKKKKKQARYLAYFQSYTNTHAPLEKLKALYDEALEDPEIIGLSIATRPDCISEEIISMLEDYASGWHLWVEYGLQSAHDQTLQLINRGHDSVQFVKAVEITRNRGIYICAHIILGLPGETPEMMLETIDFLNKLSIDGVKFHHLQIIKNSPLAEEYAKNKIPLYEKAEDYIPILCDCLEKLSPDIVVHRLASQAASKELLIAPHWPEGAGQIASMVESELARRGTYQGISCS